MVVKSACALHPSSNASTLVRNCPNGIPVSNDYGIKSAGEWVAGIKRCTQYEVHEQEHKRKKMVHIQLSHCIHWLHTCTIKTDSITMFSVYISLVT